MNISNGKVFVPPRFFLTNSTMVLLKVLLLSVFVSEIFSTPFLYNAPQSLLQFVSSASASGSTSGSNIANLRQNKLANLQDSLDDDDFFKDSAENPQQPNGEKNQNEDAMPNFLQRKLNKITELFGLLNTLTNSPLSGNQVPNEQDDFDREFNEDFSSQENLEQNVGYIYSKPMKTNKSAKQVSVSRIDFNPANIGVFFIELIGSLVGLAYGAAAQLNYSGSTTTPSLPSN